MQAERARIIILVGKNRKSVIEILNCTERAIAQFLSENFKKCHNERHGNQQTVKPVKKSSMPRQTRTGIFDLNTSLEQRFDQVTKCTADNDDSRYRHLLPKCENVKEITHHKSKRKCENSPANRTLPCFFR